jgi:hypothetical protein
MHLDALKSQFDGVYVLKIEREEFAIAHKQVGMKNECLSMS